MYTLKEKAKTYGVITILICITQEQRNHLAQLVAHCACSPFVLGSIDSSLCMAGSLGLIADRCLNPTSHHILLCWFPDYKFGTCFCKSDAKLLSSITDTKEMSETWIQFVEVNSLWSISAFWVDYCQVINHWLLLITLITWMLTGVSECSLLPVYCYIFTCQVYKIHVHVCGPTSIISAPEVGHF